MLVLLQSDWVNHACNDESGTLGVTLVEILLAARAPLSYLSFEGLTGKLRETVPRSTSMDLRASEFERYH